MRSLPLRDFPGEMNSSDLTFQCNDVIVQLLSLRWCGRQRRGSTSGYPNTWMVNINNKLKYVVPQVSNFDPVLTSLCLALYIRIYIYIHMMVDQNSFIRERPFFANKKCYFRETFGNSMFIFCGTYVRQSWYPTFAELSRNKCYFRELGQKKLSRGFPIQHIFNMHGFRN